MPDRLRALLEGPVMVAPMGGGPSTPALVAAASEAGALGFLAGAYKQAAALKEQISTLRGLSDRPFGVNLFVPGKPTGNLAAMDAYLSSLVAEAHTVGTQLGLAEWDDDHWHEKVDLLVREPVPAVTFTFGCPTAEAVHSLQAAGSAVGVTVTAADEVELAIRAGADFLVAQGYEAGGHRATFRNDDKAMVGLPLSELLRSLSGVALPVLATGGIMDGPGVAAALHDGAIAVLCGTAFLRCPESGANRPHKDALADPRYTTTAVTRAFSGRPARGLLNGFMARHVDAPAGYPEINNATRFMRAAAAAHDDTDRLHLWAGTGFRQAQELPAAEVAAWLMSGGLNPSPP